MLSTLNVGTTPSMYLIVGNALACSRNPVAWNYVDAAGSGILEPLSARLSELRSP